MELRRKIFQSQRLRDLAAAGAAAASAHLDRGAQRRVDRMVRQTPLPCAQVYQTTGQIEDTFNYYRTKAKEAGWDAGPDKFILCRHIYIDDTDTKGARNFRAGDGYFFSVFNRGFNEALNKGAVDQKLTAALTSERSFNYFRQGNRDRLRFFKDGSRRPDQAAAILSQAIPIASPNRFNEQMKQIGADHFMGMFHIGNMKHDNVVHSLELFKKEIMPRLS